MATKGKHSAVSAGRKTRALSGRAASVGAHGIATARPTVGAASWSALKAIIVALLAIGIVAGASLGFASAGGSAVVSASDSADEVIPTTAVQADLTQNTAALAQGSHRDVSSGVAEIAAEEEAARIAAEKAAKEEEARCIARAQEAQAESAARGGMNVYAVDWSVGRDAFMTEWTKRIDDYLSGSPLAGYGATFAEAAWNNGVDPRWSPAISNTESTKGRNCFAWHNAWGWTNGAWGDWVTAINAHVKGLAEGYGYTISYANAKRYCPPNYHNWYRDTLYEMSKI